MALNKKSWLFIGHLLAGQTSKMRMNALLRNDVDVKGFCLRTAMDKLSWLQRRWITSFETGEAIRELNSNIIQFSVTNTPDYIWFDKPEFIEPETLSELKKRGAFLIYYTPDPYFSLSWKQTRHMNACLPLFDLLITSKSYELREYQNIGPDTLYLPLGFCDEVHRPMKVKSSEKFSFGFVGGWEPRRQSALSLLMERNSDLKIWGYAWDHLVDNRWTIRRYFRLRRLAGRDSWSIQTRSPLRNAICGGEIYSTNYARILSEAKISIGFLRNICPDQHTTRTFEIPACGSMLLADRTKEHLDLFEDGKEASFFSSDEEMVEKALFYANNDNLRMKIAERGLKRVHKSGYSYRNRMRIVLEHIARI